eukprot:TRINITY_DN10739_c0_g1_i1.p1 TRINITY_DN10739_c0_g1~~TRINITY_DN10739_c0_g1_i1.p1  ORF type:complete len:838 (-),score=124.06 TRINITY_DN10739_c0_g1_i1:319-2535(-)
MSLGNDEVVKLLSSDIRHRTQCEPWASDNDKVQLVLLHDSYMGGSHISRSQYGARSQTHTKDYQKWISHLRSLGLKMIAVQDVILANRHQPDFEQFIMEQIELCPSEDNFTLEEKTNFKRDIVKAMTVTQLGYAVTHHISLEISRDLEGQIVAGAYRVYPTIDLLARRGHLITSKGVVLSGSKSIKTEMNVMKFCLKSMGLPILTEIPDPLKVTGHDFVPGNDDVLFIGTGHLTDEASVRVMLEQDVFGTDRVAVVRDFFDRSDQRPGLDSVFMIIDTNLCVVLDTILGQNNLRRRLVREYVRDPKTKTYLRSREDVEFEVYLLDQGFTICKYPEHLYKGGIDIINFGGRVGCANKDIADLIIKAGYTGIVDVLEFDIGWEFMAQVSFFMRTNTPKSCETINKNPNASVMLKNPSNISHLWTERSALNGKPTQITNTLLMVAPVGFCTNPETFVDNHFMKKTNQTLNEIEKKALEEFSSLHLQLRSLGINVWLHSAERFHNTPDATFPNNWFSTHPSSEVGVYTVVFYPMKTISRRAERRQNIISELQNVYGRELTFTQWEFSDFPHFLESTGVLVLDRIRKIAYASLSERCYEVIATVWAKRMGYQLCLFHSTDIQGRPIYHTNVMMAFGSEIIIICIDSIEDPLERKVVEDNLNASGLEIVTITREQMNNFCGNCIELQGSNGKKVLCMSERAYNNFTPKQKEKILKHVDTILHSDLSTIETIGGGSLRCMVGELF